MGVVEGLGVVDLEDCSDKETKYIVNNFVKWWSSLEKFHA